MILSWRYLRFERATAGLLVVATLLAMSAASPLLVSAQSIGGSLLGSQETRKFGLETMWFTQVDLDRSQGRLAGLYQHVSSTQSETIFEIIDDGQVYLFSERDRDAFGELVTIEGANKKAEEQRAKIAARLQSEMKDPTTAPAITKHVLPQITFYATSQRGMVHAIDGHTGKTRWSTTIGNSKYPTTAPGANDRMVAVINGSTLYVLLADSGEIVWQKMVGGAPGAGPAVSDQMVFVPMISGAVESYNLEDPKRPVSVHRSFGHTFVQPVVSRDAVAWPTDRGNLYVGNANSAGMRFRIEAKDAMNAAPAFMKPGKIFATSLDGYLYCIDEKKGAVLWRFTTGEATSQSPIAFGDYVYLITDNGSMFAVSATEPVEQWVTTNVSSFVAGNDQRLYVLDPSGDLVILDAKSGSKLGKLSTLGLDLRYANASTDRLIVGTTSGVLQCLRETERRWPSIYVDAEPPKKSTIPNELPGQKKPTEEAVQPGGDPFGDGGADPFGAPAKPMPMPAEPDPFGDGGADPFGAPAPAPAPMPAPAEPDPFG